MAQDDLWRKLDSLVGLDLRTWSREKGELKTQFRVLDRNGDRLRIRTGIGTERSITEHDFQSLSEICLDYRNGVVGRKELQRSVNSSYILGLLHRLDIHS